MKDYDTLVAAVEESAMVAQNTHATTELGYRIIETLYRHPSGEFNMTIGWPLDPDEEEGMAFIVGICPLEIEEAKEWLRENSDESLYQKVFG